MNDNTPNAGLRGELATLCASVPPADTSAAAAARARLDRLTKPRGSLGQIEALLERLAGATGHVCPTIARPVVLLAAADHGVAAEGVSAYPREVTAQMVHNYLAGGAAINALAANAGARLVVLDAGVDADLPEGPDLPRLGIRRGSGNIAREPAMTDDEALRALLGGAARAGELADAGADLLALGEMGIGNTTPAAAITSAVTGAPPDYTVGRGTGIDDATLARKVAVVAAALARWRSVGAPADGVGLLAQLGGLEIATLAGATLGAAARRVPILLDGYITAAAALAAVALAPTVRDHLIAAHCSAEPGHAIALEHLGLSEAHGAGPLLRLGLRLGEGSGAALAIPLITGATRLMREMATFDEAGVAEG
ncbi:MAG: nicotinate-nucleotide--dimethylbenzimidazole phosphoribosyltransferase [Chloroflexi bacterium OHK40]